MAWSFFVLFLAIMTARNSDSELIRDKSDAMAKSISDQNRKVEEESDKLVKAIDKTGKQIESKNEEEKFLKASSRVDELMKTTEDAVEKKGKEAEAKQMKAEQLVEQKGKIIERIGKELGHTIIRTDKSNSAATSAGKKSMKKMKAIPNRRMSISYSVKLPAEKDPGDVLSASQSGWNDEFPSYNKAPIEKYTQHEISLAPFPSNDAQVDNDAISASHYIQSVKLKRQKSKVHHPSSLATLWKHKHRPPARLYHQRFRDDNEDEETHNNDNDRAFNDDSYEQNNDDEEDDGNDVEVENNDDEDDTSHKHRTRPVNLTGGMNVPLPENLKNEIEEERLLRAAQRRAHHRLKDAADFRYGNQEEAQKAEKEMERKWNRIHSLGSPELMYHWPFLGKNMGYLKGQQLSVVSPGQVELMQTEFPDYPHIRDAQNEGVSGE